MGILRGPSTWESEGPSGAGTPPVAIAIGDVNGDGYADAAFMEFEFNPALAWNYRQATTLFIYAGGPDGLSLVPTALDLETAYTGNGTGVSDFALLPSGDRDGDGFGDLHGWSDDRPTHYPTRRAFELFGGHVALRVARPSYVEWWSNHGDFNADGHEDLLFTSWFTAGRSLAINVRPGGPGPTLPDASSISTCVAGEPVSWMTGGAEVIDYNEDGYSDIVLGPSREGPGIVYLGGPMGLDGARCVSISAP